MYPHAIEYPERRVRFNLVDGPMADCVVAFIGPRPADITGCEIGHACWIMSDGGQVGKAFRLWQCRHDATNALAAALELDFHTYNIISRNENGDDIDLKCHFAFTVIERI